MSLCSLHADTICYSAILQYHINNKTICFRAVGSSITPFLQHSRTALHTDSDVKTPLLRPQAQ